MVPIGLLTRHGASEFGLGFLSVLEGSWVLLPLAQKAESVFGSQVLKALREQGIDIDTLAELLAHLVKWDRHLPWKITLDCYLGAPP